MANKTSITIGDMAKLAKRHEGRWISKQYLGNKEPLEWLCKNGHKFPASPNNVLTGHWCPICAGNKKKTIEDMQNLALLHGGECISKQYKNSKTKLLWQCRAGHRFRMRPNNVQQGQWCKHCAGLAQKALNEIREEISNRDGLLISDAYTNNKDQLKIRCNQGHVFFMSWNGISQGHWCDVCADRRKNSIEGMQQIAKNRGGKCISKNYFNNKERLEWECAEGHRFFLKPNSVQQGSWCRECSKGMRERLVRRYFESIFAAPFPSSRPGWLMNSRGNQVELDGFNADLGLGPGVRLKEVGEYWYWTKGLSLIRL